MLFAAGANKHEAILDTLTLTPFERRYRQATLDLLFHNTRVHTHLDWHETSQWLDTPNIPTRLAWQNQRLIGILAASVPMEGTCWLRLIGLADNVAGTPLIRALWADLGEVLREMQVYTVALLIINDWLADYAPALGFAYNEDIVTLRREGYDLPERHKSGVTLRVAGYEDLARLVTVDQSAFKAPWQLSEEDLRQARRIATSCTVALKDQWIVGYQLSTLYRQSGHLARLAVLPEMQGSGVGGALLDDLIRRFLKRGVRSVTVNTQSTNLRSQRLYQRYGFERNGYDLPVWVATP